MITISKMSLNNKTEFAEVPFYFLFENLDAEMVMYALVSTYGPPDADMLEDSYGTLHAC